MSKITLVEQSADPDTPASGQLAVYSKQNSLFIIDDAGVITDLGAVQQSTVWAFGNDDVGADTTVRYMTYGFSTAIAPTAPIHFRSPIGGDIRNLRVRQNTPNGNGGGITYTVRSNGQFSSLNTTISSTGTDGSNLAASFALNAGDLVDVAITKAASVGTSPSGVMAAFEVL